MGGEREFTVKTPITTEKRMGEQIQIVQTEQTVRIHEKERSVHFHDDVNKWKVAVPTSVWANAWNNVISKGGSWSHLDVDTETTLDISVEDNGNNAKKVEVRVLLSKVEGIGPHFAAMAKFTKG